MVFCFIAPEESPEITSISIVSTENGTGTVKVVFSPPLCSFTSAATCLTYYNLRYSKANVSEAEESEVRVEPAEVTKDGAVRMVSPAGSRGLFIESEMK